MKGIYLIITKTITISKTISKIVILFYITNFLNREKLISTSWVTRDIIFKLNNFKANLLREVQDKFVLTLNHHFIAF